MDENKILENVQIIKFDYKRHESLQIALKELLQDENYINVIKGKVVDPKYLSEVQAIYEAYKELKTMDLEEIIRVVKNNSEGPLEEDNDKLFEVVVYLDDKLHVMVKNLETTDYEEVTTLDSASIKYNKKNKDLRYILKENNGYFSLYNFLGKNIINDEAIVMVSEGIFRGSSKNPYKYYDYNGEVLFIEDNSLYSKNVNKLLSTYRLNYRQTKDILKRRRKYEFLNTYTIDEIYNGLMRLTFNGYIAIYNFNGEVIVDTVSSNYCYIGKIDKNSDENVVNVATYDNSLNKTYGYFDLDLKREIVTPKYMYAYPWVANGILISEDAPIYVFKDGKEITLVEAEISLEMKSYYHELLTQKLWEIYRNNEEGFYQDLFVNNCEYKLRRTKEYNFFYVVKSKVKLRDDLYFFTIDNGASAFAKKEDGKWHISKYVFSENIYDVKTYYEKFGMTFYSVNAYMNSKYDPDNKNDIYYMLKGFNENNLFDLMDSLLGNYNTDYKEKKDIEFLNNSTFGLKRLEGVNESQNLLESKALSKFGEDTEAIKNALMTLVAAGVIDNDKISSLLAVKNKEQDAGKSVKETQELGFLASEGYNGRPICIRKINSVSDDGNIIWANFYPINDGILDRKTKRIICNSNYEIVRLDVNGNFVVRTVSEGIKKYFLLNSRKGTLISSVDYIQEPINGVYLVVNNGKCLGYDEDGNLVVKEADDLKWVYKYYVDNKGFVKKTDVKLQVTNANFVYLIDDDGDKLIKQPIESLELLQLLCGDECVRKLKKDK